MNSLSVDHNIFLQAQLSTQQGGSNSTADGVLADGSVASLEHQSSVSSEERLRKLEMELAQTKLALVESQCHNQELERKLEEASSTATVNRSNRASFLGRGKRKT